MLGQMLDSLDANGWLESIDAVLTGYLPTTEHVAAAKAAVARVRAENPAALYLCDPRVRRRAGRPLPRRSDRGRYRPST